MAADFDPDKAVTRLPSSGERSAARGLRNEVYHVSVSGYSASHDQAARNFVTMVRLFRMARMGADTDTEDLPGEDWRSKAEAKGETHTEDPLA
jgi:hypothetical protein